MDCGRLTLSQDYSGHSCADCSFVKQYMAFGCTQYSAGVRSDTEAGESGVYFQKAWIMLHQLLMDNDLWALKAITLMVSPTSMSTSLGCVAWHQTCSYSAQTSVGNQLKQVLGSLSPSKCQTGSLLVSTRDSFTIVNLLRLPCQRVEHGSIY